VRRGRVIVLVALLASLLGACEDGGSPERGTALTEQNPQTYRFGRPFGTDQELMLIFVTIENQAEEALTVRRVEPLVAAGASDVAELVRASLTPRVERDMPLSLYTSDPPTTDVRADATKGEPECASMELEDAEGIRLAPGEEAVLALHVRPKAEGTWRLEAERVVYELGGEEYFQDVLFSAEARFRDGAHIPMHPDDQSCADPETLLPGWP
jgi:hypothetical protein